MCRWYEEGYFVLVLWVKEHPREYQDADYCSVTAAGFITSSVRGLNVGAVSVCVMSDHLDIN